MSLEFSAEGFEPNVELRGLGLIAEYAIYNLMPQVRLRYPLLNGRLVPYALAGLGLSYGELNDIKQRGLALTFSHLKNYTVGGALGLGIEYFVARNIAVGMEAKYEILRDHVFEIQGQRTRANLDTVMTTLGFRVYFGESWFRGH